MATAVDICNLALSLLGDSATLNSIDPPDGSPQAGHCSRWYPVALRKLYEEHNWSFSTKRVRAVRMAHSDRDTTAWTYAYAVPSDCVRMISVSSKSWSFEPMDFEQEYDSEAQQKVVYTNAPDAVVTYVSYIHNAEVFPSYFVQPLVLILASYLVGPLKKSGSTSQTATGLLQQYEAALSRAKNLDLNSSVQRKAKSRIASQLEARRV